MSYNSLSKHQPPPFFLRSQIVQTLRCGLVLVSSAIMDHDGYLHLISDCGSYLPLDEMIDSLTSLALDQVYVGQRVCVKSERGVLACEVLELHRPDPDEKQNYFRLVSLRRMSNGEIAPGALPSVHKSPQCREAAVPKSSLTRITT